MLGPEPAPTPILQFGTGRFLQAHVDLFVSEALAAGNAIGPITVVQTTASDASSKRLAALARGAGHRVVLRGWRDGRRIDTSVHVDSIRAGLNASRDWPKVRAAFVQARVIVSNTADRGYELDPADQAALLAGDVAVPRSFPAKLVVLLWQRWRTRPEAPLSLYPCELIQRNGDTLRGVVRELAAGWHAPPPFLAYIDAHCVWLNSLVDRIVSEPIEPAGAVAEPFALWAIEAQPRMVLPCTHPDIVVTDVLARYERLKLLLLNLGHSWLAERWIVDGRRRDETVFEAMNDAALREGLEQVWRDEVLPVFDAAGEGAHARQYLAGLRERLLNPFLAHRLADIAHDHVAKKARRFAPVVAAARALQLACAQPCLREALERDALAVS